MAVFGIFHKGSGLGNQLHRYLGVRYTAKELGCDFGMIATDLFKGKDFITLDLGKEINKYVIEYPSGRVIPNDTTLNTIDEEFQNEKYFSDKEWVRGILKVEPLDIPDNVCVINFRGGEYVGVPELFLPKSYWEEAIKLMGDKVFEVHTDDVETAKQFFPNYKIIHDVGLNWRSIRYAKYLILSNSSFAIIPAYMGDAKLVIAPMYWARRNRGYWHNEDNNYSRFKYI